MKYTCVICGFSEGWEETDDIHGDMWSCEVCGDIFCSKCLIDAIGTRKYWEMMQSGEYIICPECFRRMENMKYWKHIAKTAHIGISVGSRVRR